MEEKENLDYDILTLLDEDGNEHQFELVDSIEHEGEEYLALVPIYENSEDRLNDDGELLIMKVADDEGEQVLDILQDEREHAIVSELFAERLADYFEFDFDELDDEDEESEDED